MNFTIMPYATALNFPPKEDEYNVFIRIVNPKNDFDELEYRERFQDVLYLKFLDYTEEQVRNGQTLEADYDEDTGYKLFSSEDAERVVDFFEKHRNCDLMAIHCHAGKSRSAAIGVGWCVLTQDSDGEDYIVNSGEYRPNPDVVTILKSCLAKRGLIKSEI